MLDTRGPTICSASLYSNSEKTVEQSRAEGWMLLILSLLTSTDWTLVSVSSCHNVWNLISLMTYLLHCSLLSADCKNCKGSSARYYQFYLYKMLLLLWYWIYMTMLCIQSSMSDIRLSARIIINQLLLERDYRTTLTVCKYYCVVK